MAKFLDYTGLTYLWGKIKTYIDDKQTLTDDIKESLIACFEHVAWIDDDGQEYVDALFSALYQLTSITATFVQGQNVIYDTDTLDSLKQYLTVTANYGDGTSKTVTGYTLSGTLVVGTSAITVSYGGKTTTFNVAVSEPTREMLFGTFANGYALSKGNNSSTSSYRKIWRSTTTARATTHDPVANNNYVFTVTDSSKYNIAVYDVTDNTPIETAYSAAVDGVWYQGGDKSISWKTSDSATTSYVWIALKKMDGTAFTTEELANGAEAVFTFTQN